MIFKSESRIQSEIMLALSQNNCTVWRANAGKVTTKDGYTVKLLPEGFPDLFGFRHSDNQIFFVEVKNAKGKLREKQVLFQNFANQHRLLYVVARSSEEAIEGICQTKSK